MCCLRRKKKLPNTSDSKTHCNTPPNNSVMQRVEVIPGQPQSGDGTSTRQGLDGKVPAAAGGNVSNLQPQSTGGKSTGTTAPTPKKEKNTKENTEQTCHTLQATVDNETKSKLYSAQSHQTQPESAPQPPPTPSKGEASKKKPVDPKKSTNAQSKRKKVPTETASKKLEGKNEESEHFEEGDGDKSREDPSVDDTLKGIGTEMPHFES